MTRTHRNQIDFNRLLVDVEPEHVGGIVTDRVEVELRSGEVGRSSPPSGYTPRRTSAGQRLSSGPMMQLPPRITRPGWPGVVRG